MSSLSLYESSAQRLFLCLSPFWIVLFSSMFIVPVTFASGPEVTATNPITHTIGAPLDTEISATFSADLNPTTVTTDTFVAWGNQTGWVSGTVHYESPSHTVTLNPEHTFRAGEIVYTTITSQTQDITGHPAEPYQWSFTAGQVATRCVGAFTNTAANLPAVSWGSVAWGDYDNDHDLDVLVTGFDGVVRVSDVYRNDNGTFVGIGAGLTPVSSSAAAWGDYDNDGDLDILLSGLAAIGLISRVYRNDNGAFVDAQVGLLGGVYSSAAWADYDNDGDLDILLTGATVWAINPSQVFSKLYRNDGGTFTDTQTALAGVCHGAIAWGDYDNDGDLDLLLSGWDGSRSLTRLYRNSNSTLADSATPLPQLAWSSVAWGDYDDDHDLDLLLTGYDGTNRVSDVFRNDNGTFVGISAGLIPVSSSSAAWGDYDNDGDLDILLSGTAATANFTCVPKQQRRV